jgi:hypothetical protein
VPVDDVLLVLVPLAGPSWPCLRPPSGSMPANHARPRRRSIGPRQAALQIHRWLPDRHIVVAPHACLEGSISSRRCSFSPPQCNQAPVTSPSSAAARNPGQPIAPAVPAAKLGRQSRLWNAGPAALAALEQRQAAERQAQLRHGPRDAAAERSARAWDTSEDEIHLHLGD